MVLLAAGCATTSSARTEQTKTGGQHLTARLLPTCTLPHLPRAGSGRPDDFPMSGPAVSSLQGGGARRSFALDSGGLVVNRPNPGDRPAVSRLEAECAALASFNANNFGFSDMALQSGVAIGYGRVTVRGSLLDRPGSSSVAESTDGGRAPVLPKPMPYRDRLAWVAVFEWQAPASCPSMSVPPRSSASTTSISSPPAHPAKVSYDYQAFLVDATTGAGALVYTEGRPPPCGEGGFEPPSADVPVEQYSVPWKLVARQPAGYSATIRAQLLSCEGYDPQVLADRDSDAVEVVALGPVAANCGRPSSVSMTLDAATVTSDLPRRLTHAPLGPAFALPTPTPTEPAMPSTGSLRSLTEGQNGSTITISVGSVLVSPPLVGAINKRNPTRSSDPSVLGPLGTNRRQPIIEFRAWRSGRAILTQPGAACAAAPRRRHSICAKTWHVTVVVRAARR